MLTVIFAGQLITGAWVSLTVTVNEQVPVLPAASVTVYVTVVTPTLKVCVPTLFKPVAGEAPVVAPVNAQVLIVTPQLSLFDGLGVFTLAEQTPAPLLAVMLAGQVTVGACVSFTVTVKEQVELLFEASLIV